MRFVHINAPEPQGRLIGTLLCQLGANKPWVLDSYSIPMRERCHAAFALIDKTTGRTAPFYCFEGQMDVPLALFEGMTPRAAYASFREWVERSTKDPATPGRWAAERIRAFIGIVDKQHGRKPCVCFEDAGQASDHAVKCMVDYFAQDEHMAIEVPGQERDLPNVFSQVARFPAGFATTDIEAILRDKLPSLFLEVPPEKKIEIASELPK